MKKQMPFCSQCGNQVGDRDAYCGRCGTRQPPQAASTADPFSQISPRTAAICCYIPGIGWIASIVVLASQRFRRDRIVRFHAFQGLYLFVAWLLDGWVLRPISQFIPHFPLHGLVEALLLGLSIFMIVKAAHDEAYSLPLFGELAQRSVAED
ncbi:MAG: hypothetical protein C5B51_05140 [Terriglobia bacterium]|nr:MAG: hypothetical protein C5B51_05140 [Terriglobia bacterium]